VNLGSFPLPLGEGEEHQLEIKLEIKKPVSGTKVVHFFITILVHFLIDLNILCQSNKIKAAKEFINIIIYQKTLK
jgi:hypothetical protein